MTIMNFVLALTVASSPGVLPQPQSPGASHESATDLQKQVEALGPGGSIYVPDTLEKVVDLLSTAVVAEIVEFGDLRFQDAFSADGRKLGVDALAVYKVRIKEVVYNKQDKGTAPLGVNSVIELTQRVGRDDAKAFIARQSGLKPGDESLMFLWYRPGAGQWSIVPGPFQFRRAGETKRDAATVLPAKNVKYLDGRLAMTASADRVSVDWDSLVTEIKRTAASQAKK